MSAVSGVITSDPTLHRSFRGHSGTITALDYRPLYDTTATISTITRSSYNKYIKTPISDQLASGSSDNSVMIWSWYPSMRAYRFVGHTDSVTTVNYSPDGALLASSSLDCTVRIWEPIPTGRSCIINTHSEPVRSVHWNSNGTSIVTGSDDNTARIWAIERAISEADTEDSENNNPITTGVIANSYHLNTLIGHTSSVLCAQYSIDNRLIATGSADNTIKLFDSIRNTCLSTYYEHNSSINSIKWHPLGNILASCSSDNSIKLFDSRTNQLIQHYSNHDSIVNSISFHPSGNYLISGSDDYSLKFFDLRIGHQLYNIHGHSNRTAITATAASPDGKYFASGGIDQRIITWNCESIPEEVSDSTIYSNRSSGSNSLKSQSDAAHGIGRINKTTRLRIEAASIRTGKNLLKQQQTTEEDSAAIQPGVFRNNQLSGSTRDQHYKSAKLEKPHQHQYQKDPQYSRINNKSNRPKTADNSLLGKSVSMHAPIDTPLCGTDVLESDYDCKYNHTHIGTATGTVYSYEELRRDREKESKNNTDNIGKSTIGTTAGAISTGHSVQFNINNNPSTAVESIAPSIPIPIRHNYSKPERAVNNSNIAIAVSGSTNLSTRSSNLTHIQAVPPSDNITRLPESIAHTLSTIVQRLDFISSTLNGFDVRLTMHENKIDRIELIEQRRQELEEQARKYAQTATDNNNRLNR